jgi:hypothetical protein
MDIKCYAQPKLDHLTLALLTDDTSPAFIEGAISLCWRCFKSDKARQLRSLLDHATAGHARLTK